LLLLLDVLANPSCSKEAMHWCAGKTTLLRDVVSLLANKLEKRVVVVDTSNEIGGDGAVPHSCLGKARRMPVYDQSKQHEVLLQAVQNHNPQVTPDPSAALLP
jgi:stage III sporulation protein SpoIIIAA